jgi:hypothetical protein
MSRHPERDARIIKLVQSGIPFTAIGQLCGGISRQRVGQVAKTAGLGVNPMRARLDYQRTRVTRAEAKLHDALLFGTPGDPEVNAAMEKLSAEIHELIVKAQVPA